MYNMTMTHSSEVTMLRERLDVVIADFQSMLKTSEASIVPRMTNLEEDPLLSGAIQAVHEKTREQLIQAIESLTDVRKNLDSELS